MDLSGSWQYIEETAGSRLAHNKTKRHVSDYGEGIEVIGVAGELIVRRFLGLDEKVHEGFDRGVDITFFGMLIDVKATILTPNENYRFLQWPSWKKVRADYIVMTAIDPIYKYGTILGYATKGEVKNAPINPNRSMACHEIPIPALHPASDLVIKKCRRLTFSVMGQFPTLETQNPEGSSTPRPSGKLGGETGSASRGSSSETAA